MASFFAEAIDSSSVDKVRKYFKKHPKKLNEELFAPYYGPKICALEYAIRVKKPAIIELLIEELNCEAKLTPQSFADAIALESFTLLKAYFKANPDKINDESVNYQGFNTSPLIYAANTNIVKIVQLLVEELKCNINKQESTRSNTAAYVAARWGHSEILQYLIEKGADPMIPDRHGWSPMIVAAVFNHTGCMKLLHNTGKVNINHTENEGNSALMYAIIEQKVDAVRLLLQWKANPSIKNDQGQNALQLAREKGNKEIIQLIENAPNKDQPQPISSNNNNNTSGNSNKTLVEEKTVQELANTVECASDADHQATLYCKQCQVCLCSECDINKHKKKQDHVREAIQLEVLECESDPDHRATIHCEDCNQSFCKVCDQKNHKAGQSKDHKNRTRIVSRILNTSVNNTRQRPMTAVGNLFVENLQIQYKSLTYEAKASSKLGAGGFGIVYRGEYSHDPVAIKECIVDRDHPEELVYSDLIREAAIMSKLSHSCIVAIRGYCIEPKYCLVMELMEKGSLEKLLQNKSIELSWSMRYEFIKSISKGVAFLHSKRILHRDLKSLNVLVNEHNQCKLSDFGLSKERSKDANNHTKTHATTAAAMGSSKWMAPEIVYEEAYTNKSDIYSLGILIWEIAARTFPTATKKEILAGIREAIPSDCPVKVRILIESCRNIEPKQRPSAEQIMKYLNDGDISKHNANLLLPDNSSMISEEDSYASVIGLVGNLNQSIAPNRDNSSHTNNASNSSNSSAQFGSFRPNNFASKK